jgi:hypothetical protein
MTGLSLFKTIGNGSPATRERVKRIADKTVEVLGEAGVAWRSITLHLTNEVVQVDTSSDVKTAVAALKGAGFASRQHNLDKSKTICNLNGVDVEFRNTSFQAL